MQLAVAKKPHTFYYSAIFLIDKQVIFTEIIYGTEYFDNIGRFLVNRFKFKMLIC